MHCVSDCDAVWWPAVETDSVRLCSVCIDLLTCPGDNSCKMDTVQCIPRTALGWETFSGTAGGSTCCLEQKFCDIGGTCHFGITIGECLPTFRRGFVLSSSRVSGPSPAVLFGFFPTGDVGSRVFRNVG